MTTLGRYRHLTQCSTPAGHFNVLAIDHRGGIQDSLRKHAGGDFTDADFVNFKERVMYYLAPHASAVLTDPDFGFPSVVSGALPGQVGLLAPLEVTDYSIHPTERPLKRIPNWSVEKIKRCGGSGVKVLVFYHPDAPNAAQLRDEVAAVVAECAQHDIPLFLEPIAFSLETGSRDGIPNDELRRVVVESARVFCEMGIDVLKAQFPLDVTQEPDENVWRSAVEELDSVCSVPWALLSAGVGYEVFRRQAELACEAGASGVIVGRAVWTEAVTLQGDEREHWLATTGVQRMNELGAICAESAMNWKERTKTPQVGAGWFGV